MDYNKLDLDNVFVLSQKQALEYLNRLEAIAEFIQNIDNYADDDVISATYFEYSNKFIYELI